MYFIICFYNTFLLSLCSVVAWFRSVFVKQCCWVFFFGSFLHFQFNYLLFMCVAHIFHCTFLNMVNFISLSVFHWFCVLPKMKPKTLFQFSVLPFYRSIKTNESGFYHFILIRRKNELLFSIINRKQNGIELLNKWSIELLINFFTIKFFSIDLFKNEAKMLNVEEK